MGYPASHPLKDGTAFGYALLGWSAYTFIIGDHEQTRVTAASVTTWVADAYSVVYKILHLSGGAMRYDEVTTRPERLKSHSQIRGPFGSPLDVTSRGMGKGFRFFFALSVVMCLGILSGCSGEDLNSGDLRDDSWAMVAVSSQNGHGERQTVALLDGGITTTTEVAKHVIDAWEPPSLEGLPRGSHATEVAGLIAGKNTSVEGTVDLLDVRVLDSSGHGNPNDIAAGILWAISAKADIIAMSLKLGTDNEVVRDAIESAHHAGIIVVASASNDFQDSPTYPADYPNVIGVTGMDRHLLRAPLARSQGADVVAPGSDVQTIDASGKYVKVSGTSMATAIVAGIIAKCLDASWNSADIMTYAETSDVKVTFDERDIPLLRCPSKGNP